MEVTTIIHNRKLHFTSDGRLWIYKHKLATKVNKLLKWYSNGKYIFKKGEEGFFKVPPDRMSSFITLFSKLD